MAEWPSNTDHKIFIDDTTSLTDLIELIQEKWPGASLDNIKISSESIQTTGCNCCSSRSDYTDFIVIELSES